MKNWFYYFIYFLGYPPMRMTSSRVMVHRDRVPRSGPFILASTHSSPYDVPLLIKDTPRVLDFVSITEVFRYRPVAWLFTHMGAFPLDRSRRDMGAVRIILDRLARRRAVAMFPEGNIRTQETSVLNGGRLKSGVARIARMAGVPIIPVVLLGSRQYQNKKNWIPFFRIRYGIIYGEPIVVTDEAEENPLVFESRLRQIYLDLIAELKAAMERKSVSGKEFE